MQAWNFSILPARFRGAGRVLAAALVVGCSSQPMLVSGGGGGGIGAGDPGGTSGTGGGDSNLPCQPDQGDFASFRSWSSYLVGDGPGDSPHTDGIRYAYINKIPPSGSVEFPLCTIIVKQTTPLDGGPPNPQLFAMVKQDDSYNDGGVPGWEWFELAEQYPGSYIILWSGPSPPPGCGYAPTGGGNPDCNACHSGAAANDYVLGSTLQLSSF